MENQPSEGQLLWPGVAVICGCIVGAGVFFGLKDSAPPPVAPAPSSAVGKDAGISGGGSESKVGSGSGEIAVTEAKKHLFKTAEQLEGPFVQVVREYVGAYEIGDWPIRMLDTEMQKGRWTPETRAAYRKYREAVLQHGVPKVAPAKRPRFTAESGSTVN